MRWVEEVAAEVPVDEQLGEERRERQDHREAVHREQLVVLLLRQELEPGTHQLGAHQRGLDAADAEEEEGREDVQQSDLLVVGRRDPVEEPGLLALLRLIRLRPLDLDRRAHVELPPCRLAHVWNCDIGMARMLKFMYAWFSPQYSA